MSKSTLAIRDAAKFTVSGYVSSVCNFVSAVIVRRILGPFFMGIYAELSLIFEYAKYNHFGMLDSLDRQIPYYNGRKEFGKTEEIKNIGVSFSLFTSLAAALAITVFSYLFKNKLTPELSLGLKVIAVLVVAQSMTTFYVTLTRTHHLFGPLSKYIVFVACCDIFFKAMLGVKYGVIGVLWATVITLLMGLIYLFRRAGLRFRIVLKIPVKAVRSLLGIGFPLLLAGFTFMALRSIDRIMIIALLRKEDLGYYSIAIMMHSLVFQLPNLIYTVLFPRFYEAFGDSKDNLDKIRGYLEKPTIAFAYLFPIIIGIAVIFLPLLASYVLPRYTQGITPALILLFGTFFISITNMSGYLLIALKKQYLLVLIGAVSVVISVFLNLLFVKVFLLGIRGVALGTAVTYFLYSLFLIGCTLRHYIDGFYGKVKFFVHLYAPLLWALFIFCLLRLVFRYTFDNLMSDIGKALLQTGLFLILTFPLLALANRKIALYERIKNAGFGFFRK
jgi:O-antigen/teichoic acid export membrane protein